MCFNEKVFVFLAVKIRVRLQVHAVCPCSAACRARRLLIGCRVHTWPCVSYPTSLSSLPLPLFLSLFPLQ